MYNESLEPVASSEFAKNDHNNIFVQEIHPSKQSGNWSILVQLLI